MAELITYLSLTDSSFQAVFDEHARERVHWNDRDGSERVATIPRVTFTRRLTTAEERR